MRLKENILIFLTIALIVLYFVGMRLMMLTKVSMCILIAAILLSSYIAARLHIKRNPGNEIAIMRRLLLFYLIVYVYFLVSFTLGTQYFYRPSSFALSDPQEFSAYLNNRTNFIPFRTIADAFTGGYSISYIVVNIAGNILALMPMGFFLPALFKKQRNIGVLIATVSVVVILIEGLQMLFLMGACDIDDFILNVLGAVIMYLVIKIPMVHKLIEKIFLSVVKEL